MILKLLKYCLLITHDRAIINYNQIVKNCCVEVYCELSLYSKVGSKRTKRYLSIQLLNQTVWL